MAVRSLTSILCSMLLIQILFSPIALAQTASDTSTTSSTTTTAPSNLDLTSTTADLTATASGTIQIGDSTKTINVNDKITAAEQLALFQVLNGGQSIVLSTAGNAVSGQFQIVSSMPTSFSQVVVPQGVTGIQTTANLNISGNFANYGSFYAVSTNSNQSTAYISANNIFNYQGAILSTMLPSNGLPGITGAISNLSLQLNAINNVVNAGTISSAANLSIFAGGTITNALPAGVTGAQPVIQAINNVNLSSNVGNIINQGLIQSTNNNINITSQLANNLVINNIGGRLEALSGLINVRDSAFSGKFNTNIFGGDLIAKELNIFSGDGIVDVNVKQLTGTLNINGGVAHIVNSGDNLTIGTINLTGDPTFYNQLGDIVLTQDLNFAGQNLALIAAGDIISDGCQIINTSSANAGGSLTLIAGAAFQSSGSQTADMPPAPPDDSSIITVTGGLSGGGRIDFATHPVAAISTVGGFNAGGNVLMVAYGGTRAGSGQIFLPDITLTTGSGGTDLNGSVTLISGASSGTGIQTGSINAQGASNGSGSIFMLTAAPSLSGCANCTGNMQIVDGKIVSGSYNTNPASLPTGLASINTGDLSSSGAAITLIAGGDMTTGAVSTIGKNASGVNGGLAAFSDNMTVGNINTSGGAVKLFAEKALVTGDISVAGADGSGRNGGIQLIAGAATGDAITTGNLVTSGATAPSGNIVALTSSFANNSWCPSCGIGTRAIDTQGAVKLGNVNAAGNVTVSVGGDLTTPNIVANGIGQTNGGVVGLLVDNGNASPSTFFIGGMGPNSVGNITVAAGSAGAGQIGIQSRGSGGITVINKNALDIRSPSQGAGGRLALNATNGNLKVDGSWSMDGISSGGGGLINFAGQTIEFTSPVAMTANATTSGNGGSISISANNLVLPSSTSLSANGANNGSGGSLLVSSTTSTSVGGSGITMTAKGSGTGLGGTVRFGSNGTLTMNGASAVLDASANNMLAGRVDVFGSTAMDVGSGSITATAVSNGGGGGVITLTAGSLTATTGTVALRTGSTPFGGGSITFSANNITTGTGAITANADSVNGFGGRVTFNAGNISAGDGGILVSANGGLGGGRIDSNINATSGTGTIALNANGTGTGTGSGGVVSLTANNGNLALGTTSGQISLNARGYSSSGSPADGGTVTATASGNISLDGNAIDVSSSAPNGNGGLITLRAGTSGQGILLANGTLNADGRGTGNGGVITLQYADVNPFTNNGTISASAPGSGIGGTIVVNSTIATQGTVGVTNNGVMAANSAGGFGGSININSAGGSTPSQDVSINGAGSFNGALNSTGRNVTISLTNTSPLQVGSVRAIGGNLSVTTPTLQIASGSTLSSTGTTLISSSTVSNNGSISSSGALTLSNAGNLSVSGTGTITAPTITANSTGGSTALSQQTINGIISGSSATAYSVSTTSGDLTFGSVSANQGNVSLIANGGNLTINDSAVIAANLGNVTIQDTYSSGIITLRPSATVTASSSTGVYGTGQVYIVSGAIPTTPVAGTTPNNMTVTLTNGGTIYFGSNGITSQCCNQSATVNGSTQVVFNTDDPSHIVLTSNNTINANNQTTSSGGGGGGGTGGGGNGGGGNGQSNPSNGGTPPGLNGVAPPGQGGTPPGQGGTPPGQAKKETTTTSSVPTDSTQPSSGNTNSNSSSSSSSAPKGQTKKAYAGSNGEDSEFVPVAFIQGGATIIGKRAEEVFGTQTATAFVKQSGSTDLLTNSAETLLLRSGDIVVATEKVTNVRTEHCTLSVSPNSIVQITATEDGIVKVRSLFDGGKQSVNVVVNDAQKITLIAGQEAVITENNNLVHTAKEVMSEDRVGRRRVKETSLEEGKLSIATCEYSLLSLIDDSAVLRQMFYRAAGGDRQLVDKMMKTAVALTTVTAHHGVFARVNP